MTLADQIARAAARPLGPRAIESLLRLIAEIREGSDPSLATTLVELLDHRGVRPGPVGGSRSVRAAAEDALRRMGPPAMPALERALTSRTSIASNAVSFLGEIEGEAAERTLIAALSHASPMLRWKAAGALGARRASAAAGALRACLQDPDANVRQNAGWALEQISEAGLLP